MIKEFLPNEIAVRQNDATVMPKSATDADNFVWGMDKFLQEAKILAKFKHHNIVQVARFFKQNQTAYFVMDYEEGEDLDQYCKPLTRALAQEEILAIIIPVLDGLKEVHEQDFLHRDIKPGNIFIRKNGSPMLIDFGASRFAISAKFRSITQILTPGYAPVEQYSSDISKQGAYTDIYAIGAVLYTLATGHAPVEAQDRSNAVIDEEADPYRPLKTAATITIDDSFAQAVDWALQLRAKKRPQSVIEFREVLMGNAPIKKEPQLKKKSPSKKKAQHTKNKPQKTVQQETKPFPWLKVGLPALLILGGIVGLIAMQNKETANRVNWSNNNAIETAPPRVIAQPFIKAASKKLFTDPISNIEFIQVKSGSFTMGSTQSDNEKPPHKVSLTEDYYLGKTEVSQKQWQRIMGNKPSYFQNCGEDCPVEQVSWNAIQDFIKKLNKETQESGYRYRYRLPTEAEWEYAA